MEFAAGNLQLHIIPHPVFRLWILYSWEIHHRIRSVCGASPQSFQGAARFTHKLGRRGSDPVHYYLPEHLAKLGVPTINRNPDKLRRSHRLLHVRPRIPSLPSL